MTSEILAARRELRIAMLDLWIAKVRALRAMNRAERALYPVKPGRPQAE